jgi:hypothetical protein
MAMPADQFWPALCELLKMLLVQAGLTSKQHLRIHLKPASSALRLLLYRLVNVSRPVCLLDLATPFEANLRVMAVHSFRLVARKHTGIT